MANNTTINSELFVNLLTAAQYSAYETSIARQLTTVFDQPMGTGKTVQIPVWAGIAAQVITDESAATSADTNTTSVAVTLAEIVSAHTVTDMLRDSTNNVLGQLGDQAGRAIAEAMDSQVFDLFGGFAEAGPGAAGTLTVAHIMKAAAKLRQAKLTGPFFCVLNPGQALAVKKELASAGGTAIPALSNVGNNVLQAGYIGQVSGVAVYESGLIAVDVNADAVGAVFAPSAIATTMRGTVTMEAQRQAKARATDLVLTANAGAGILHATYGVKLTSDATL
jgi:hypothetical protein